MKASSISLFFEDDKVITDESTGEKSKKQVPYLINLVDSPGHRGGDHPHRGDPFEAEGLVLIKKAARPLFRARVPLFGAALFL